MFTCKCVGTTGQWFISSKGRIWICDYCKGSKMFLKHQRQMTDDPNLVWLEARKARLDKARMAKG